MVLEAVHVQFCLKYLKETLINKNSVKNIEIIATKMIELFLQ